MHTAPAVVFEGQVFLNTPKSDLRISDGGESSADTTCVSELNIPTAQQDALSRAEAVRMLATVKQPITAVKKGRTGVLPSSTILSVLDLAPAPTLVLDGIGQVKATTLLSLPSHREPSTLPKGRGAGHTMVLINGGGALGNGNAIMETVPITRDTKRECARSTWPRRPAVEPNDVIAVFNYKP